MARIYTGTIPAGGNSGEIAVTKNTIVSVQSELPASVEIKHASAAKWCVIGRLTNSEAAPFFMAGEIIRVVNTSGAANKVDVY